MLKLLKTVTAAAAVSIAFAASALAQSIEDASWLAGRWVGEGLGGELEETWAPPVGGQMVGHFRLMRDGQPVFYEIMLMDVVEGGVRMRVKHFNPDFVGWEEKDAWVTFEPSRVSADALAFNGLIIRRTAPDAIEMRLTLRRPDGVHEEILTMRRAPL
jgi:hypothetical protein